MRADVEILRKAFRGTVFTPADAGYEDARVLFNRDIRARPAALCRCAGTDAFERRFRLSSGRCYARTGSAPHW